MLFTVLLCFEQLVKALTAVSEKWCPDTSTTSIHCQQVPVRNAFALNTRDVFHVACSEVSGFHAAAFWLSAGGPAGLPPGPILPGPGSSRALRNGAGSPPLTLQELEPFGSDATKDLIKPLLNFSGSNQKPEVSGTTG